jgi:drug/metabolite transporter (DMT)-like permease
MIALGSLLFAINGTVSKLILQAGVGAPDLTTLRALGACLGLLAVGAVLRPGLARFRISRPELPMLIAYGLAGFFAVPMLYFVAISRLPVGIALLFEYTAPLLVALWARFGQRRPVRPRLWVGLALSLLGLACVVQVWSRLRLDGVGVLAGVAAALLLACFYLMSARGVTGRDTVSLTGWAFGVSAVAGLLLRLVTGHLPDWSAVTGQTPGGTPVWLLCGYLLIGGTIAPYMLIIGSLRHLPATSVSILSMAEPVLAAGVAWAVIGERLNVFQLAGGLVLLIGVGLAETARMPVRQNDIHAAAAPERDRSPARA